MSARDAAQNIDPGPAPHEVVDHLCRHARRLRTDLLRDDAVVAGHQHDLLARGRKFQRPVHGGELFGQVEQPAERPARHGQRIDVAPRLFAARIVRRFDSGQGFFEQFHVI